ncbi:FUSC family protein [Paraburkholderia phosphatilytica]|uniref:FUSC family protein n=1 Tax=Paraburkholderia phosphatilytica TaxID=2282883 RepID=UPI000E48E3A8|nr:FUSC family protein [Paraburkholderia phosphatilytica]
MVYPSVRDWLFSVKTFAAAMIALYLGLALELPRPYWAMATVYIVSNPFVGATRSKALYRALGTALGAAGAVLVVPPFVESPWLFSVVVALWTGTLLYLSISDRTARSYVFMLAGYTLPLIALPAVTNPTIVFDLAITRTEEILLGIVCASIVGGALFPSRLGPSLRERTDAWFRDAALYATQTLEGRFAGKPIAACRQRLAAHLNGLEFLLSQLSYDHAHPDVVVRAEALRGRMQIFLPIISSLADPLAELFASSEPRPDGFDALLKDADAWIGAAPGNDTGERYAQWKRTGDTLRERIAALQPGARQMSAWHGALLSNALFRLRQVIDTWDDCWTLRAIIGGDSAPWRPRFRHWRLGGTARYFDRGMMLFSVSTTVGAIVIACGLWISSGWADGASAVALAAVACSFFAALDEPAPQVFRFFLATCMSVVLAGVYLFVVLPNVHDFAMLVVMFAGPFILVGTLIPRPQFTLVTLLVAVNTATFISIQSAYDADFFVFLNSNLAGLAGLLFAFVWTRITRPFGAEFAAARLLRSSWADVALTASTEPIEDQRNLYARMLDRLMQLIPRLAASDENRHPTTESFRDLRVALNALDLRRAHRKLPGDVPAAIEGVLAGVHTYFNDCATSRKRQPVPAGLLAMIDTAMQRVLEQAFAAGDATDTPSVTLRRRRREAMHALVGMRLSLFPGSSSAPPAAPVASTAQPGA